MTKIKVLVRVLLLFYLLPLPYLMNGQGLKTAVLKNGLTVYIWEDTTRNDVFGRIVVRAGAYDDPLEYTGLAHYLEHVLFKGTDRIATLDWGKEQPLYKQIVDAYDSLSGTTDLELRRALSKKINRLTVEASGYSNSNEFSVLVEGIGGEGLNAWTSYDETVYHNAFPASEIEKWLELYSSRLMNPVFRGFQTELETVYEEYNRSNVESRALANYILETIFENTPYARKIIGLPEHLKNPRLSELINFYERWYVPENMALILIGNVKTAELLPVINRKFGRLPARQVPDRHVYPAPKVHGRVEKSAKIGLSPEVFLSFSAVPSGHPDEIALQIATKILSNPNRTGLLDKLVLSGELMGVSANELFFRHAGSILIEGGPYYDPNQRRFNSLKATEKIILQEIDKLKNGTFDEWLVNSIKVSMIQQFDMNMESSQGKADLLSQVFVGNQDLDEFLEYKKKIAAVGLDEIKRVGKQYFGKDLLVINIQEGKAEKGEKLPKPDYDPLKVNSGQSSEYAQWFTSLESLPVKEKFADWSMVETSKVNKLTTLSYVQNKENDVFSLVMKYGVGTREFPRLNMAVSLMNNAGVMGSLKPNEFKEELSKYHAKATYWCDENYLYVQLTGIDTYLQEACKLLTLQVLMPEFDEKQYDNLRGTYLRGRAMEAKSEEILKDAARNYVRYQEESPYIDRMKESEIMNVSISGLTGDFQKATQYAASIHYYGTLPKDTAQMILEQHLPLVENEQASSSPKDRTFAQYTENVIYVVADKDARQCDIHFVVNGPAFTLENEVNFEALNNYLSGGFGSIILSEIREKNSMAYATYGAFVRPLISGTPSNFVGYIGTQSDKVNDAVKLYVGILNNMPLLEDRAKNVREHLELYYSGQNTPLRSLSREVEDWKIFGYQQNPGSKRLEQAKTISLTSIERFFEQSLKGRPMGIVIVGDLKGIDLDKLANYGKVIRLSREKLFSKMDLK